MDVIRRYVEDITDLIKSVPPMLYVHALMIVFALQNISFYFEPLVSNLKIPLLYWITCAYFPVFIAATIMAKERKWVYYLAIALGLYALILMVQSDVEYVPGAKITINYWHRLLLHGISVMADTGSAILSVFCWLKLENGSDLIHRRICHYRYL